MRYITPGYEILDCPFGPSILETLEAYGRTCYKSEDKITEGSAHTFVAALIKNGHESVLEHVKITVKIICDRGISHEIVRHRIASYSQESTRYCNYKADGIAVIFPFFFFGDATKSQEWRKAMEACEAAYTRLIELGATPQEARSVLPNSLKTEIVVTYNLREWRHFLRLRCDKRAHPQMREITIPMLQAFRRRIPIVFDDIPPLRNEKEDE